MTNGAGARWAESLEETENKRWGMGKLQERRMHDNEQTKHWEWEAELLVGTTPELEELGRVTGEDGIKSLEDKGMEE